MELEPNTILLNRYKIIEKIAVGGMGALYKAEDQVLLRTVALKLISVYSFQQGKYLIRFQQEAKALSRLNHPNIAKVYDFGELSAAQPFISIEYIEGTTLERLIESGECQLISSAALLEIFIQIADALAHAHQSGVIHRDIKPSNIMLEKEHDLYTPVLVDFGVAKIALDKGEEQELTGKGQMIGSPLYMSPEQAGGEEVTAASDQYSFGCVLFETLTGQPPFAAETLLEAITARSRDQPPLLSSVSDKDWPEALDDIFSILLDPDPAGRFSSMAEVGEQLKQILDLLPQEGDESEESNPVVPPHMVTPQQSARLFKPALALLLVSIIFVIGVIATLKWSGTVPEAPNPAKPAYDPSSEKLSETAKKCVQILINQRAERLMLKNFILTDSDLACFKGYKYAEIVDLTHDPVSDRGLKNFCDSPVNWLSVKATQVKTFQTLPLLPNLEMIDAGETEIDDKSLENLLSLKSLRSLSIKSTPVTDRSIRTIKSIPTLERLDLRDTKISKEGMNELRQSMPFVEMYGEGPPSTKQEFYRAGEFLSQGKKTEAIARTKHVIALIEKAQGADSPALHQALMLWTNIDLGIGKFDEALKISNRITAIAREHGNKKHLVDALRKRAQVEQALSNRSAVIADQREALAVLRSLVAPGSLSLVEPLGSLGAHLAAAGEYAQAYPLHKEAIAIVEEKEGKDSPRYGACLVTWAESEERSGNKSEALKINQEAIAVLAKCASMRNSVSTKLLHDSLILAYCQAGRCAASVGKNTIAIAYLKEALQLGKLYGMKSYLQKDTSEWLARELERSGSANEAKQYRNK